MQPNKPKTCTTNGDNNRICKKTAYNQRTKYAITKSNAAAAIKSPTNSLYKQTNPVRSGAVLLRNGSAPSGIDVQRVTCDLLANIDTLRSRIQTLQKDRQVFVKPQKRRFFQATEANKNEKNPQHTAAKPDENKVVLFKPPSTEIKPMCSLKDLQDQVQLAVKTNRTFSIRGNWLKVRRELLQRNWVEHFHPTYRDCLDQERKRLLNCGVQELLIIQRNRPEFADYSQRLIKSKLLGSMPNFQVDLMWSSTQDVFNELNDNIKITTVSKFRNSIFHYTTKSGLCEASKVAHWYNIQGMSKLNHPRCYNLDRDANVFWEDFNATAAVSLLSYIVEMSQNSKNFQLLSSEGKIPLEALEFALNECSKLIKRLTNQDLDNPEDSLPDASDEEWNKYLDYFHRIVYFGNHFCFGPNTIGGQNDNQSYTNTIIAKCKLLLDHLHTLLPTLHVDGYMNLWILKPMASSRGRGIQLCRTKAYIQKVLKMTNNRMVAQKYIERPFTIYNTKFDIRQWFLITNANPLTIWMYKKHYLRFSTQTFNLRRLHESIHLTNNSVQSKYKNNQFDVALPACNMWDSTQFETYLTNIGHGKAFVDIIYPGMRENIIAATLINHEKMDTRPNCFELYGADFMLTEDFVPWLIEINSNPALNPSTPVTSRMCPKVVEDVIRVVVDRRINAKANTGDFELIYKEKSVTLPSNASTQLQSLRGRQLPASYFMNESSQVIDGREKREYLKQFGKQISQILSNLLKLLQQI